MGGSQRATTEAMRDTYHTGDHVCLAGCLSGCLNKLYGFWFCLKKVQILLDRCHACQILTQVQSFFLSLTYLETVQNFFDTYISFTLKWKIIKDFSIEENNHIVSVGGLLMRSDVPDGLPNSTQSRFLAH